MKDKIYEVKYWSAAYSRGECHFYFHMGRQSESTNVEAEECGISRLVMWCGMRSSVVSSCDTLLDFSDATFALYARRKADMELRSND